jgi:hypothetical protein
MGGSSVDRKLQLLAELCRELAKFGFRLGMSDARPALFIRDGSGRVSWIIGLDASGERFEWRDGAHSHLVDDPAGAAASIAAEVWKQAGLSGRLP